MKHAILLLVSAISLFSCGKKLGINFDLHSCENPDRVIVARTVDFYTREAVPDIKFEIYEESLSLWGFTLIQDFTTDTNGLASAVFENLPTAISYHVKVFPNSDTSYIFPWAYLRFQHFECSKDWAVMMKPVQTLNLTIKNNGPMALSKRIFYVARVDPDKLSVYLNDDKWGEYLFGQITIDTIPVGFEKEFTVKVVPEEQVQISYRDSPNSLRKAAFLTDKSNIGYFTLTL